MKKVGQDIPETIDNSTLPLSGLFQGKLKYLLFLKYRLLLNFIILCYTLLLNYSRCKYFSNKVQMNLKSTSVVQILIDPPTFMSINSQFKPISIKESSSLSYHFILHLMSEQID